MGNVITKDWVHEVGHSAVMLKIMLNRLKPQTEKNIPGEQGGFRAGRSSTEQIFNL